MAGVLLQDHEVRHREFQQLSYHRIFIMLFIELNAPEHILENINYQVLTAFWSVGFYYGLIEVSDVWLLPEVLKYHLTVELLL